MRRGGPTPPAAAAPALALLVLALAALHPRPASASDLFLRNGSLLVSNATCAPGPGEQAAFGAALLAAAGNGTGLQERAEYVQAYLCRDGLSLCDGLSVLESYATIEANNSLLLPPTAPLEALELRLGRNNTLSLGGGGPVSLNRSTLSLESTNWVSVANGTQLTLTDSRVNFTDYLAWSVENASVRAVRSVLEFRDVVLYGSNSTTVLEDSTWYVHSSPDSRAPPLYDGKVAPIVWYDNSVINATGSLLVFRDVPALLLTGNSSLRLANSSLQLYNSTLEVWGGELALSDARIELHEGSTLALYCGTSVTGQARMASAALTGPAAAQGAPPVGLALGAADARVVGESNGTVALVAEP